MIIDHIGLSVTNAQESKEFFVKALEPLGVEVVMEFAGWYGMWKWGKPDFWFWVGKQAQTPMHIAFLAESKQQVDAFYQAAISAGATDNGKPWPRPEYHDNYYGAFVINADGHNIEAVFHW